MKIAGLIIALALILAWSLAMVAMLKGYNGYVASASIAGIVTLGELSRLILKVAGKGNVTQDIRARR